MTTSPETSPSGVSGRGHRLVTERAVSTTKCTTRGRRTAWLADGDFGLDASEVVAFGIKQEPRGVVLARGRPVTGAPGFTHAPVNDR